MHMVYECINSVLIYAYSLGGRWFEVEASSPIDIELFNETVFMEE